MVPMPTSTAVLVRASPGEAGIGSVYEGLHFTDSAAVLGAGLLLALLFMLWVLWNLWRESRGQRSSSPHKITSSSPRHPPPVAARQEPRQAPHPHPSPQPAPQILERSRS